MYRKPERRTVLIANGATDSAEIELGPYSLAGFITPAALTATSFTLKVCNTRGGTYVALYDSDGNQIAIPVAASLAYGLVGADADATAPWQFVKLVSSAPEGADRTIEVVLK